MYVHLRKFIYMHGDVYTCIHLKISRAVGCVYIYIYIHICR